MDDIRERSSGGPSVTLVPWWRRWRAILFGAFTLVALVNVADELADLRRSYQRAEAASLASHAETAGALAGAVRLLFSGYRTTAATAAGTLFSLRLSPTEQAMLLATVRRTHPELQVVTVIDPSGRVVVADPPTGVGVDVSDREYFSQIVRGADAVVTDLLVERVTGVPNVVVAAASRGPDGSLRGVIALGLAPGAVSQAVQIRLSRDQYPLVLDRAGRVVWHGARSELGWEERDFSMLPVVQRALAGEAATSPSFTSPLFPGPRLGAMVPVPDVGWVVGVFQPLDTALAPARRELRLAVGAAAGTLAMGLGLAFALSSWLSAPIAALARGVSAVARGDLSYRLGAMGPSELRDLGHDFNAMTAELARAREQEQALNEELAAANEELQANAAQMEEHLAELEAVNQHLDEAVGSAQAAIRVRDEFLARASHELRTPLTSILGTLKLLSRAMAGTFRERPERLLEIASRNVDSMLRLVNDLLDASKLRRDGEPLALERLALAELVGRSLDVVGPQARERGVSLETRLPPDGAVVVVEPLKFEQVLVNLLANAVKFTPEGGGVVVEAEQAGPGLVLRVRDTGLGIAPQHLSRVFEPFFQVPGATPRSDRGTGLGLTIARAIVEQHGGTLEAESDGIGRGSTFTVSLPAASADGHAV